MSGKATKMNRIHRIAGFWGNVHILYVVDMVGNVSLLLWFLAIYLWFVSKIYVMKITSPSFSI